MAKKQNAKAGFAGAPGSAKGYRIQYKPEADRIRVWFGDTVIEMNYQGARFLAGDLLELCDQNDAPYYCHGPSSPNDQAQTRRTTDDANP